MTFGVRAVVRDLASALRAPVQDAPRLLGILFFFFLRFLAQQDTAVYACPSACPQVTTTTTTTTTTTGVCGCSLYTSYNTVLCVYGSGHFRIVMIIIIISPPLRFLCLTHFIAQISTLYHYQLPTPYYYYYYYGKPHPSHCSLIHTYLPTHYQPTTYTHLQCCLLCSSHWT